VHPVYASSQCTLVTVDETSYHQTAKVYGPLVGGPCYLRLPPSTVQANYHTIIITASIRGESDPSTAVRAVGLSCMITTRRRTHHFRREQLSTAFHFVRHRPTTLDRLWTPLPSCVRCKYEMRLCHRMLAVSVRLVSSKDFFRFQSPYTTSQARTRGTVNTWYAAEYNSTLE